MFYEEKQIHNLLKCPICKESLEDPRLLPCCEETICHKCATTQILDKSKLNRYKCIICKSIHEIPEKGDFPHNKFISKISSEQPKEVYRSELVENLKTYIKNFENNKQSMFKFVDDGVNMVKSHCTTLRQEVNKAAQTLIQNIQACCDDYLYRIHKYELETIEKLDKIKNVEIEKSIKASDDFNLKWMEYLNMSMINTCDIQKALESAKDLDARMSKENKLLKRLLFDSFLTFEPDKNLLTTKDILGTLRLADKKIENQTDNMVCTRTMNGHKEWIRCIRYLTKHRGMIVSGSDDYMIKIWNVETGECLNTLRGHEDSVTCFELCDDKLMSGSWDGTIKVWDLNRNECVKTLNGHTYRVSNLKLYSKKLLVSSSWDCQIKVWDLPSAKCIRTLKGHTSVIYCLEIIGDTLLSGSVDKSIKLWSLSPKGNCFKTLHGHTAGVTDLKVLSKDKFISSSFDATIKIWHLREARCLQTMTGHLKGVFCLKLLSNDKLVSGSLDATIKIWNLKNYECFKTLSGHSDFVLCFELVDEKLVSGSADKTIKIWEV